MAARARLLNADLGPLTICHVGDQLLLRSADWSTHLVPRRDADGTLSLVGTDPALLGFVFVFGAPSGTRR